MINLPESIKDLNGAVEIILRDATTGEIVSSTFEKNIIKVFAKECIAHSIVPSRVWDPLGAAWVTTNLDLELYRPRYIAFGGSFDVNGAPLSGMDTRFYEVDILNGGFKPIKLTPGASNGGGLINPVPIAEPTRPLKRIERVYFEPSYQPAGSPQLYDDVRAMNNVVVFQTTLTASEYNGLSGTSGDFLTLTEVALIAAPEVGAIGACECDPKTIFLDGDSSGLAFDTTASGAATVSLNMSAVNINDIKEGDQVKIVVQDGAPDTTNTLNQVNPYYLVINKAVGGRDITLDRVPLNSNGTPITGQIGLLRDTFRIFSHRILNSPIKKSQDFIVDVRWIITLA